MIDIAKTEDEVEDIRDDLYENEDNDLYTFVGNDIARAFWTAYILKDMFKHEDLELYQYLLYSRQLRHVKDIAFNYISQIEFWEKKYLEYSCHPKVSDVVNYVLNNLICINDSDIIDIALHFGLNFYNEQNKEDEPDKKDD